MDKHDGTSLITEDGKRFDIQPIQPTDLSSHPTLGEALAQIHVDDILRITWAGRAIYMKVVNIE